MPLTPGAAAAPELAEAVSQPSDPIVLGTVPVPIRATPTSSRWARIMHAPLDQPKLSRLVSGGWNRAPEGKVAYVQAAVAHAVRNRGASHDCADDGYWAPSGETLARGVGDCIDIAIAKMEALRQLGIPNRDLYLVTGYAGTGEDGRGRESAALMVHTANGFWLLTERNDRVIPASGGGTGAFKPIVTYGVGKTWIHGRLVRGAAKPAQKSLVAAAPAVPTAP